VLVQERVGIGHPDKICDIVAELVKSYLINLDNNARTAIEVCAYPIIDNKIVKSKILIFGEFSLKKFSLYSQKKLISWLKKQLIFKLTKEYYQYLNIDYELNLSKQSSEIRSQSEKGAGDQGVIVAEWKWDIENLFIKTQKLKDELDLISYIGKDWKFLVNEDDKKFVSSIHIPPYLNHDLEKIRNNLLKIIKKYFPYVKKENINFYKKGSILSDSGLTGRKIFCDFPFGYQWGGGAVWGKDSTKVDNSALLYLREFTKEEAEKKKLDSIQVVVTYFIGKDDPISINLTINNKKVTDKNNDTYLKLKKGLKVSNLRLRR